jgi:hypothetical protein
MAYSVKPNLMKQIPRFSEEYNKSMDGKMNIRITIHAQREALLKYYQRRVSRLWLRRRWLERNHISKLHIPCAETAEGHFSRGVDKEVI